MWYQATQQDIGFQHCNMLYNCNIYQKYPPDSLVHSPCNPTLIPLRKIEKSTRTPCIPTTFPPRFHRVRPLRPIPPCFHSPYIPPQFPHNPTGHSPFVSTAFPLASPLGGNRRAPVGHEQELVKGPSSRLQCNTRQSRSSCLWPTKNSPHQSSVPGAHSRC